MGEGMWQEETGSNSNLSEAQQAETGKKNCPGTMLVGTSGLNRLFWWPVAKPFLHFMEIWK